MGWRDSIGEKNHKQESGNCCGMLQPSVVLSVNALGAAFQKPKT